MLNPYVEINDIKNDIQHYINMINSKKKLPQENDLKYISKLILFLKIYYDNNNGYYKKIMIYDLLLTMHSLTIDSEIVFFMLYRAFIENFLRVTLNLSDNDETGVNALFKKFDEHHPNEGIFTTYIKGEYSEACNYVHSNKSAKISICEVYEDFLSLDEINDKKAKQLILKLETLLTKIVDFIICNNCEEVIIAYYRKNHILKFLINSNLYQKFKDIKKESE